MDVASLREQLNREEHLLHLFALEPMIERLRSEEPYDQNGQNGVLLLKTEHLRVVLEVAREGNEIGQHTVPGPTLIQVLEGSLDLSSQGETRTAHAGEMLVVPHDRPRTVFARADAAFVWALSMDD